MNLFELIGQYYRNYRRHSVVLFDIVSILLSFSITYYFIGRRLFLHYTYIAFVVFIYLACFFIFGCYGHLTRFEKFEDYIYYLIATIAGSAINTLAYRIVHKKFLNLKALLLATLLIGCFVILYRLIIRTILNKTTKIQNIDEISEKNILIIGAGIGGSEIIASIHDKFNSKYHVVGIVDDNPQKFGMHIQGIKVIGGSNDIARICKEKKVNLIIFAIYKIEQDDRKRILEICQNTGVKVRLIPTQDNLIEGKASFDSLRDISVNDLLGREVIVLHNDDIRYHIENRVVVVTGGGGSIGSELCRQIMRYNPEKLIIFDIYENNLYDIQLELIKKYGKEKIEAIIGSVRDANTLDYVFGKYRPSVVFHAAAHKHVPLMEDSPFEAVKNNIIGTYNCACAADKYNVEKFVLISTDKAVNPTNVMGATKRFCEMIIQAKDKVSKTNYCAVRFGNVLGSNGSIVPLFKKQIEAGGPLTVTHKEITRFFMTIPEAVGLILQAFSYANGGEIFVLDMGEPVKIYDLAEKMIKLAGYTPNVDMNIEITGLRPGEKLYEEILMSEEGLTSTKNGKIFTSKPLSIDYQYVEKTVGLLKQIRYSNDFTNKYIKDILKKIVTTYKDPEEVNNKTK